MSYKQILRRANRILKSTINDVLDQLTKDEKELADFDELLRNSAAQQSSQPRSATGQRRSAGQEQDSQRAGSQRAGSQQQRTEGRRKPGEKDDTHYFAVLGLPPTAGVDEIKRAYKRLMRKYHPDAVATLSPGEQAAAAERAKLINEAYHIIERRRGFK